MESAPPLSDVPPQHRFRKVWTYSINTFVVLWLASLIIVALHADWPLLHFLPEPWWYPLKVALFWMFPIFVLNLYLQYRWSAMGPREFARKRWLDILMVVPVFRGLMFLRIFQVGRIGIVLRISNHIRRSVSLTRKGKKHGKKVVTVVRAKAVASQAGPVQGVQGESGGPGAGTKNQGD